MVIETPWPNLTNPGQENKIMAARIVRVEIPTNPKELIALALKLKAQDDKLGATSPVKGIKNWADFPALLATADGQQQQADQLSEQAKTATENRDIALNHEGQLRDNTVRHFVLAARDTLLGQNKGNEHVLGDFGYVVQNSPSAASLAKRAAKAAKVAANNSPAK
jgi:hypothetical protein